MAYKELIHLNIKYKNGYFEFYNHQRIESQAPLQDYLHYG